MKNRVLNQKSIHTGEIVLEKENFKVIECEKCGFKHLDPIPSKMEMAEFYKTKYYQDGKAVLLNRGKELSELEWAKLAYKDRFDFFEENIDGSSRRILDVGCGNGFFLQFMKKNGWSAVGVEPSSMAGAYAKSLDLETYTVLLEDFVEERWCHHFDVINCKEVLEHVTNPHETLELCKKLLKPSGIICIEVPNDFNCLQLQSREEEQLSWWVSIPAHINYFNFQSLEGLLGKYDLKVLSKTTGFPMELFLLMGEDYIKNNVLGIQCHQKRMRMELNLSDDLRRRLYDNLANIGMGRSCIIYARLSN